MIIKGIKDSIKMINFTGVTLNIGLIGLSFAGGSSKMNMRRRALIIHIMDYCSRLNLAYVLLTYA